MKKLEVTDVKERLKLLIDGKVFVDVSGNEIKFNGFEFLVAKQYMRDTVNADWYHPPKMYTVCGVELVDERIVLNLEKAPDYGYISSIYHKDKYVKINIIDIDIKHFEKRIVHCTKEAAIAMTDAMLGGIK